jgi:superfamily I DNA/RNA helicase
LPEVGAWLFDEQQDASALLDAVCRRLITAPTVRWAYVVGDPFQAIYGFAGSNAKCFMSWEVAKERTMPKSWRCPKPIAELGEACLRRMHEGYFDRGIAPADHDGVVREAGSIEEVVAGLDPRDSWLLVARTNHQASRMMASLHGAGKPARWTNSIEGVTNRSAGLAALYNAEKGKPISGRDWAKAIALIPTKGRSLSGEGTEPMLERGSKTRWKNAETADDWDVIFPDEMKNVGATDALISRIRDGSWVSLVDNARDWRRQAEAYGPALAADPTVRVGTIHSVKGSEADNVAMLTTISKRVEDGAAMSRAQHDEECRIAYVGVTRARQTLTLIKETKPGGFYMEV